MIYQRIVALSVAAALSSVYALSESWHTAAPHSITLPVPSCRPADAFTRIFVPWVKHTVGDTGWYAAQMRRGTSLPQTSRDSVSLVTTDSVCALLKAKFARIATGRDTLSPDPVSVVSIAPSKYLVTDLKFAGSPWRVTTDSVYMGDEWTEVATITVALDSARVWRFTPISRYATPY
jgi:hypothetical protein